MDAISRTHPTILVGHGDFGRDVLRRVLLMTASRDALTYEDLRPGEDPSQRRIRDLVCIHVPGTGTNDADAREGPGGFDLMSDLYRQIDTAEKKESLSLPEAFSKAILDGARTLLNAAGRAARDDRMRIGLDVIVVAKPSRRDLGQMGDLLRPAMDALQDFPNLAPSAQGAERLNFIQILNFEHFWEKTEGANDLRRALADALDSWDERRRAHKATFGRVYLLDRHTNIGDRDDAFRADEVALFLEYLLFEGRRDKDQHLFQRRYDDEPPLSAFGIRAFERSAGLVTRLAAARFGLSWLHHLGRPDPGRAKDLQKKLHDHALAGPEERFRGGALKDAVAQQISEILRGVSAVSPPTAPDWALRAKKALEDGVKRGEEALSDWMARRARAFSETDLPAFREQLRTAVDEALHTESPPFSIVGAAQALDRFGRELDPQSIADTAEGPGGTSGAPDLLRGPPPQTPSLSSVVRESALRLEHVSQSYGVFVRAQVAAERLRRFWLWLTFAATAALVPRMLLALAEIEAPDPTARFSYWAWEMTRHLLHAPVLASILLIGFLLVCFLVFQKRVQAAGRRASDFWLDPARGRFADAVRALFEPEGPLGAAFTRISERLGLRAELSARAEMHREVIRALSLLTERAREVTWARSQFSEFLMVHGLDPAGDTPDALKQKRWGAARWTAHLETKLDDLLALNPATNERFQSVQQAVRPFEGWNHRFGGALLLYPLRLLDRLSADYRDPVETELRREGLGKERAALAADLGRFLKAQHDLCTGFLWSPNPGERTQAAVVTSVLAPSWRDLPGVAQARPDLGPPADSSAFEGRAYVVRVEMAVTLDLVRGLR